MRAVIASSFERIHRQNLVGMGVLPIVVGEGWPSVRSRIRSGDCIAITAEPDAMAPRAAIPIEVRFARGGTVRLHGQAAVETRSECNLLAAGGFFAAMLRAA